jgi:hypothetical protein
VLLWGLVRVGAMEGRGEVRSEREEQGCESWEEEEDGGRGEGGVAHTAGRIMIWYDGWACCYMLLTPCYGAHAVPDQYARRRRGCSHRISPFGIVSRFLLRLYSDL